MASLYSKQFLKGAVGSLHPLWSAPVPEGYVWDVRDILCTHPGTPQVRLEGFQFVLAGGDLTYVNIWNCQPALGGIQYHWEGRCIMITGDEIQAASGDLGTWDVIITGYQLTVP